MRRRWCYDRCVEIQLGTAEKRQAPAPPLGRLVILAVAASLNAIVIAPAFAADDAKSIAERVIVKWGKSTTKAMLRP